MGTKTYLSKQDEEWSGKIPYYGSQRLGVVLALLQELLPVWTSGCSEHRWALVILVNGVCCEGTLVSTLGGKGTVPANIQPGFLENWKVFQTDLF